jgi:hypothetical protein
MELLLKPIEAAIITDIAAYFHGEVNPQYFLDNA